MAARNQREGLPVVQTNAFGMGYGAILMFAIAFGAYLTLLGGDF